MKSMERSWLLRATWIMGTKVMMLCDLDVGAIHEVAGSKKESFCGALYFSEMWCIAMREIIESFLYFKKVFKNQALD